MSGQGRRAWLGRRLARALPLPREHLLHRRRVPLSQGRLDRLKPCFLTIAVSHRRHQPTQRETHRQHRLNHPKHSPCVGCVLPNTVGKATPCAIDTDPARRRLSAQMTEDDRPRPRGDAASLLAKEPLDSYSQDELIERIALLEAEIARVRAHHGKAAAHREAADALFGRRES